MKELTEVLQRQKTRVAALQKDRADMAAQLASYQPAEQDKLRAEMGTLRERVGELAGIKVSLTRSPTHPPLARSLAHFFTGSLTHFCTHAVTHVVSPTVLTRCPLSL